MKLQAHPKQGDTIKGYTIKGFNKEINERRGYTTYYLYLENEDGVRRIAEYIPKRKDVQPFEKHVETGHATYYLKWDDCNLNRVTYVYHYTNRNYELHSM